MRQRGDLMQAPPGIDRRPQAEGQALARYPQPCAEHDVAGSSRGGGGGGRSSRRPLAIAKPSRGCLAPTQIGGRPWNFLAQPQAPDTRELWLVPGLDVWLRPCRGMEGRWTEVVGRRRGESSELSPA